MSSMPLGASLYQDVVTYADFGEHRTATDGENEITEWLVERLQDCGLAVSLQSFPVDTFFVHKSHLKVNGEMIECFPLWLPRWTGPQAVTAPLAPPGADTGRIKGRIALVKATFSYGALPFSYEGDDAIIHSLCEAGAAAVLVISNGPSNGIHSYNAPNGTERWLLPVALVSKRQETRLTAAAEQGTDASLLLDGSDETQIEARNVIGTLERGSSIVVISTPKSGWFTCAGERGPGVALFLALARWASQRDTDVSYVFDANTGHEIGGLGIERFIEELAPPPDRVRSWIHLGANIATWDWEDQGGIMQRYDRPENYRIVCDSDRTLTVVESAFTRLPALKPTVGRGLGEMRIVIRRGYAGFGVNGGPYRYFHSPDDLPQNATSPALLETMAMALIQALEMLEVRAKD